MPDNIPTLTAIVEAGQVWPTMTARYNVANPVPPWKSSLDALCDVLDRAEHEGIPTTAERRSEEDELSSTVYAELPYPENQLVALAHSLVVRGVIGEAELKERLVSIRARLEA